MTKRKNSTEIIYNTNETANMSDNSSFSDSERTLRADAKENREQILQTAHKIFAEKGLSVPISEIAREAGIGIGTVYRHFPTKDALFIAVNNSYKQKFTEEAKALIHSTDPGKAFFDFFFHVMEECFTNRSVRDFFRIGTFRVQTITPGPWLDFQLACGDLLTRAKQAKTIREDVDIVDLLIFTSGLLMALDEPEDDSNRSRFNHLMSIICDGLRYK